MLGKKKINNICDDLVKEAAYKKKTNKISSVWKMSAIFVYCLCLILFFAIMIHKVNENQLPKDRQLVASDITSQSKGLLLEGNQTKAYFTMVGGKVSDLLRSPIKNNTTVPALMVYQTVNQKNPDSYFNRMLNNIIDNGKNNLGISLNKERYDSFEEDDVHAYSVRLRSENFSVFVNTSDTIGTLVTRYTISNPLGGIKDLELFGDKIKISVDETDESIQNKLSDALALANKIFGTDGKFQRITRDMEYSGEGNFAIFVQAYEISDDINKVMYNQYMGSVRFLFMGGNESEISLVGISYDEYEIENAFSENVKLISVSEAEDYLEKGYIFVGHVCRICMSGNLDVDFTDYDGLEIVYRRDMFGKYIIPFYAFYKQIDDYTYAVAYVPAVEIQGLQEYFEEQESWHNTVN